MFEEERLVSSPRREVADIARSPKLVVVLGMERTSPRASSDSSSQAQDQVLMIVICV